MISIEANNIFLDSEPILHGNPALHVQSPVSIQVPSDFSFS